MGLATCQASSYWLRQPGGSETPRAGRQRPCSHAIQFQDSEHPRRGGGLGDHHHPLRDLEQHHLPDLHSTLDGPAAT
ncbi:hypothetical protein NEUTE2DRAFT_98947 [Neurospora tetrasperma FGSC 2509]|nr:hypothetical protein NEUTE2DRAFT_98947 [Neurospora tetrasperma FGSC 2509]